MALCSIQVLPLHVVCFIVVSRCLGFFHFLFHFSRFFGGGFPNAEGRFPFHSGGLGAGGVFTWFLGRRPRNGRMENEVGERSRAGKEGKGLGGGIWLRGFVLFILSTVSVSSLPVVFIQFVNGSLHG